MRFRWSRRYLSELEAIGDYLGSRNPRAAERTVKHIHQKIERLLVQNPFLGRIGQLPGTRELVIAGTPYVVAYRVTGSDIEVLFVQHGAREWPDEL